MVRELVGIPAENLMISCSHTHSGPWASGRLDYESLIAGAEQDQRYVDELVGKIVGIVLKAKENAFPAAIGFGSAYCGREQGIGGNRRVPDGPCDPHAYVLAVKDLRGTIRCVLVNYALHPTVLHEDSSVVSADYPGYIRNEISEEYPDAVMLFTQGASGDQSTRFFRQGQSFAEAERIGRAIASAAVKAMDGMVFTRDMVLKAEWGDLPLKIRSLPSLLEAKQRVQEAELAYGRIRDGNAPYLDVQRANLRLLGAEDLLGYVMMMREGRRIELLEDEQPAAVQVFTMGGLKLIGLPGEVFVDFGLEIRKQVKADMVMIQTIANGCLPGYVCTRQAFRDGGYEADTSLLADDFGEGLVRKALELAQRSGR